MAVREIAGMRALNASGRVIDVTVRESDVGVRLDVDGHVASLSIEQVRFLTRQLNRLARKVEARQQTTP